MSCHHIQNNGYILIVSLQGALEQVFEKLDNCLLDLVCSRDRLTKSASASGSFPFSGENSQTNT